MPKLTAFYLPQFHPIPENDEWWGRGFTEWTNVASALPQFRGHKQPVLPGDLGFYDLRLPEARQAQAELAAEFGIDAFCYWHYWFEGRRILERPFEEVLTSGQPDFPFCLAWANESWTRTWLGSGETLLAQTYSAADDSAHARWLVNAFADPRYLRVDGRPVFLIYAPVHHPDIRRFAECVRRASQEADVGNPILLGMNGWCPELDCRTLGLDGTLDFQPQFGDVPGIRHSGFSVRRTLRNLKARRLRTQVSVVDYRQAHQRMVRRRLGLGFPTVPTALVGWDNTPRRGRRAIVLTDSDPEYFRDALAAELDTVARSAEALPLVFVNAWNEWAEGNHLEPATADGRSHLEAVRSARQMVHRRMRRAEPRST